MTDAAPHEPARPGDDGSPGGTSFTGDAAAVAMARHAPLRDRLAAAGGAVERVFRRILDWGTKSPWRAALLVALVALATILPGLTELPVTDRDEARFAQATKQMLETGDLIDIRFQSEPRWKKPVGIYWLQALSASAFGGVEAPIWAYRIPSALAVLLGALATLWAARPLVGPRAAVLAGLILPSLLLSAAEANIAKTDATLMLTAILVFGALARMLTGTGGRSTWAIFWGALGAAILLKGPVVPVIALLCLAVLAAVTLKRPRLQGLRPLPGIALLLTMVLPWVVAIWIVSRGAFFAESVGRDLLGKVAEGQESHGGPPGLYLALVWLTFWPWAAFLPAAVGHLWAARRERWSLLLIGWVVPFWLVLEAVPTKLPHYVLPLYPALAIAVAALIVSGPEARPGKWARGVGAFLMAFPAIALALAVILLPIAIEEAFIWPAALLGLVGGFAAMVAARAALDGLRLAQAGAGLIAALAIYPAVLHFAIPAMATAFPSPRMAALAEHWRPCASGPLVSLGYREPSLVFLAGTATRLASPEAAAEALMNQPGAMVLVESRQRPRLDEALGADAPRLVVRGSIAYVNYNRGKRETAVLLTRDDSRWDACSSPR